MIIVYFLPVETVNGAEQVAGTDIIHDALLLTTDQPDVRKLIMDPTPAEHTALASLALLNRLPSQAETDLYNSEITPFVPDPDTIRAEEILSNPAIPIPAPDLAELVRIFGRRLGYRF